MFTKISRKKRQVNIVHMQGFKIFLSNHRPFQNRIKLTNKHTALKKPIDKTWLYGFFLVTWMLYAMVMFKWRVWRVDVAAKINFHTVFPVQVGEYFLILSSGKNHALCVFFVQKKTFPSTFEKKKLVS